MASREVEEKDEIEKLVHKTNTGTLRDEVNKKTSKAEVEISRMNRDQLMTCIINIKREKEAGTWVGTTKSVGGTPTRSHRRMSDRIRPSIVDKELESLQVTWASETAKARLQDREDRLEKEERDKKDRLEKEKREEKAKK